MNPRTVAVLSVLGLGGVGLFLLPLIGLLFAWYGASRVGTLLFEVTGALFPFLFVQKQVLMSYGATERLPVFEHPFLYTVLHWLVLVSCNVRLVRIAKRPTLSALVLVSLTALVTAAIAASLGLEFAQPRT